MLRSFALCLFLINIKLMGSITCSKPSDLYTSSINPYSITVTSNNMGDACISWVETVEDNNYLRVSQKFPGLNWSKPETISPRDFCNQKSKVCGSL